MLLLGEPGFYVASDLMLCSGGGIKVRIPRLVRHVLVVLLVVLLLLLLDLFGRGVAEVGRIHGWWVRRVRGAVVHHGCVLQGKVRYLVLGRTGDSEGGSGEGAREDVKTEGRVMQSWEQAVGRRRGQDATVE